MLNYEFPPLGGGAANANYYLLKGLAGKGIQIDLVTSSPGGYSEEKFSDSITVYRLDVGKKGVHFWTQAEILRYMWKAFRFSKKLMKEKEYDLVHAWFGFPCGVMARLLGVPYIVSLRGSDVPGYNERFALQYVFLRPLIVNAWGHARAVVANSVGLKELASRSWGGKIKIIPNGVDTKEFKPVRSKRKKLRVLCVSRLIRRKGIDYLIEAIAKLDRVGLCIVGDGNMEKELGGLASWLGAAGCVEFVGAVPHERIHKFYEKADVFVLPSLGEGMSNSVLEAMASGLPVIVTDTGGTKELVNGNGFVVPMRDPAALAGAIKKYAKSPKLLERHGKKSRKIAKSMSWENTAAEYLRYYGGEK